MREMRVAFPPVIQPIQPANKAWQSVYREDLHPRASSRSRTNRMHLLIRYYLENPALSRVLIVTPAVYSRLVVNHDFSYFWTQGGIQRLVDRAGQDQKARD